MQADHVVAHNCISLGFTATNTAHSVYFERFVVVYRAFSAACSPPRASIMSIMGPVRAPNFLLDTTYMRLQDHSKTLIMLRWLKVRNEGPIVLMMLAQKNVSYTLPTVGGSSKNALKNHLHFGPPTRAAKGGGRRHRRHPV